MPRRIGLASGDGIVCLEWAGMTDSQLRALGVELDARRGDRGCQHDDEQLNLLLDCLGVCRTSEDRAAIRAELDELREFHIKCVMRDARRSAQRERNAALSALEKSLSKLEVALRSLPSHPTSIFIDRNCDDLSPFSIFNVLPFQLNCFALQLEMQMEDETGQYCTAGHAEVASQPLRPLS